jgi:hypothetical protein
MENGELQVPEIESGNISRDLSSPRRAKKELMKKEDGRRRSPKQSREEGEPGSLTPEEVKTPKAFLFLRTFHSP